MPWTRDSNGNLVNTRKLHIEEIVREGRNCERIMNEYSQKGFSSKNEEEEFQRTQEYHKKLKDSYDNY